MEDNVNIRNKLADLEVHFCQCGDRAEACAKDFALDALDGDDDARRQAHEWRATAQAHGYAASKINELRVEVERDAPNSVLGGSDKNVAELDRGQG